MRWFSKVRRNRSTDVPGESLNLDGLLAEGLKDRASAKRAIEQLNRERETILRVQKLLMGDGKTLTPGNVKMIARGPMAELGTLELSRAMRGAIPPRPGCMPLPNSSCSTNGSPPSTELEPSCTPISITSPDLLSLVIPHA